MSSEKRFVAQDLRSVLLNFSFYGGIGVTSKLINFVSVPLLTHHLSVGDYGILDYFTTLSYLLVVVLICGQDTAVTRFFYECKSVSETQNLVTTSLLFQLALLVAIIPALWALSERVSPLLVDVSDNQKFFKLILLQVPFLLVIDFCASLLKWITAKHGFFVLTFGFAGCQVSTLISTIIFFELNVTSALAANLFASVIFSLVGLFYIRNWLAWPSNFLSLKKTLPFAFPIGLVSVMICIQPIVERGMINTFLGLHSLGIYALAGKILLVISLIFSAFQSAWGPYSMAPSNRSKLSETSGFVLKLFCVFGAVLVLVTGLFADPLIRLLGNNQYLGGAVVVAILAFGQLIQNIGWILELGIRISKKTYLTTCAFVVGFLVMVVLVNRLAPSYELLGVAAGILVGKLTTLVAISIMAGRVHRIPYDYWSISFLLGLTGAVIFGGIAIRITYGSTLSLLLTAFGLGFIGFWSWFQLFTCRERQFIRNALGLLPTRS